MGKKLFFHIENKKKSQTTCFQASATFCLVIPLRFERKTHALEGRCSIQLSYGTILNFGAKVRFSLKAAKKKLIFFCQMCPKWLFYV